MLTPAIRAIRYSLELTLTLLVTSFHADYADHALALDDLAVAADALN
jgi:hypothetical protein